jgi:hypothetical protein
MRLEIPRRLPGARGQRRRYRPVLEAVESRLLLSTITVTTVADDGPGSLRQAINTANAAGGTNTIAFNIPGSGLHVISPTSSLPPITSPVIIDGYTQPGSKPNTSATGDNAVPTIVIDGSGISDLSQSLGLQVKADNSTVEGLVIENFGGIGVVLSGADDVLQGDFIGTNASGMTAQPNRMGVGVIGAGDVVGGTSPASRDLVSGNDIGIGIASVAIGGPSLLTPEAGSVVQGDLIGTDATGAGNLGNIVVGVALLGSGNKVGGTAPGQANTIAFNGQAESPLNIGVGVVVVGIEPSSGVPIGVQSTGNLISGNSIYDNHNLGIGLLDIPVSTFVPLMSTATANIPSVVANFLGTVNLSPVPNAQLSSGSGPNDLQNFPVLASAVIQDGVTTVHGTLESASDATFTVQFFSDPTPDATGYGEGKVYLGQTTVATGPNGLGTFAFTTSAAVPVGQSITATAIDRNNNTSEFSKDVSVTSPATTSVLEIGKVQRFGIGSQPSTISLTFSTALNPSSAQNLGNYSLFLLKQRPHSHTHKEQRITEQRISIARAVYDPTTMTVTLTPAHKLQKHGEYSLTVGTGLTDLNGNPLAGSNGTPGTNFTTILGPAAKAPK